MGEILRDYSKEEAYRRFEETLRAALKTPPQPKPVTQHPGKKKARPARASPANEGTGQP